MRRSLKTLVIILTLTISVVVFSRLAMAAVSATTKGKAYASVRAAIMIEEKVNLSFGDFTVGSVDGEIKPNHTPMPPGFQSLKPGQMSEFLITGPVNRKIYIVIPDFELIGPGTNKMQVLFEGSGEAYTLDGEGHYKFSPKNATLKVYGNQAPGEYTAEYNVTVSYE